VVARKALRRVQGDLRRDIDQLEANITWANIIIMPLFIGLVALGLAYAPTPPPSGDPKSRWLIGGNRNG
jgi:hypothetical protein